MLTLEGSGDEGGPVSLLSHDKRLGLAARLLSPARPVPVCAPSGLLLDTQLFSTQMDILTNRGAWPGLPSLPRPSFWEKWIHSRIQTPVLSLSVKIHI